MQHRVELSYLEVFIYNYYCMKKCKITFTRMLCKIGEVSFISPIHEELEE